MTMTMTKTSIRATAKASGTIAYAGGVGPRSVAPPTPEGNKAVVRRFVEEVVNGGSTAALRELVAGNHVTHELIGDHYGPEGVRIGLAGYREAFPDLEVTIDDLVAEGDRVVRRFTARGTHTGPLMGVAPTGRVVTVTGIWIDRLAGGRLVESWLSFDALGLLRQIGAIPPVADPDCHP
jgi:predicted ester cyclase